MDCCGDSGTVAMEGVGRAGSPIAVGALEDTVDEASTGVYTRAVLAGVLGTTSGR